MEYPKKSIKRIVDDIINKYDYNNSPLKVVTKQYDTYQDFRNAIDKYLISRRVYLEDMTSSL